MEKYKILHTLLYQACRGREDLTAVPRTFFKGGGYDHPKVTQTLFHLKLKLHSVLLLRTIRLYDRVRITWQANSDLLMLSQHRVVWLHNSCLPIKGKCLEKVTMRLCVKEGRKVVNTMQSNTNPLQYTVLPLTNLSCSALVVVVSDRC